MNDNGKKMEHRLTLIESAIKHIKDKVDSVCDDVGIIKRNDLRHINDRLITVESNTKVNTKLIWTVLIAVVLINIIIFLLNKLQM